VLLLQVATVPVPPDDPCGEDARCRLEYARATEAARRRAEYLEWLAAYAEAVDRAEEAALPHRERHPLGADYLYTGDLPSSGVSIGYTVAWPLRLEFFGQHGEQLESTYKSDPNLGSVNLNTNLQLTQWGFLARFFTARWMIAPVFTAGLGWASGSWSSEALIFPPGGGVPQMQSGNVDVGVHTLYGGCGVDWQWNWLHVLLGYRFAWAFYTGASDPTTKQPNPPAAQALSDALEHHMHGVELQIGARY